MYAIYHATCRLWHAKLSTNATEMFDDSATEGRLFLLSRVADLWNGNGKRNETHVKIGKSTRKVLQMKSLQLIR